MNIVERYKAVYRGEPVDRVPISAWLGLPFLRQITGKGPRTILEELVDNPLAIVKIQEDLGLDPVVLTVDDYRRFSMHRYWRLLYSWPEAALETWQVKEEVVEQKDGVVLFRFTSTTPEGPLTWTYHVGNAQVGEDEPVIKDEMDFEMLMKYLPEPEMLNQDRLVTMLDAVGDRAFFTHQFLGVWGQAANMRGLVNLATDIIERPDFVHRISQSLMERSISRVRHLAQTGIHSMTYDQTWTGIGFSRQHYTEFMLPYDKEVVKAAKQAGLLVSFHNCGQGMRFLDEIVSTGADSLETLTPKESSGDFDLAEVKRRVGDQITLQGGFNERMLSDASPDEITSAVKWCLDTAAGSGRYILRSTGQVFDSAPGNIEVFTQAGRDHGSYL